MTCNRTGQFYYCTHLLGRRPIVVCQKIFMDEGNKSNRKKIRISWRTKFWNEWDKRVFCTRYTTFPRFRSFWSFESKGDIPRFFLHTTLTLQYTGNKQSNSQAAVAYLGSFLGLWSLVKIRGKRFTRPQYAPVANASRCMIKIPYRINFMQKSCNLYCSLIPKFSL